MSYTVTLKPGLVDVALPSGTIAQGGQTHTLTDDQYLALSPTAGTALFSSAIAQDAWAPVSQTLKGWTFDPTMISSSGSAPAAGVVALSAVQISAPLTSTSFYWSVSTAGSGLTAGQNFVGLYDNSGTRVWSLGVDTDPTTTGLKTSAMAVTLAAGKYWAAALFNGTTIPALGRCGAIAGSTAAINLNLTGSAMRSATNGSGKTTLPASLALSSNAAGTFFWFAIQ